LLSIFEKDSEDKIRLTNAATLMSEKEIKSRNYRDAFISLKKEQNLEIYQDVIVFSEESTVNES
jgi:urease accessory protein UreE